MLIEEIVPRQEKLTVSNIVLPLIVVSHKNAQVGCKAIYSRYGIAQLVEGVESGCLKA